MHKFLDWFFDLMSCELMLPVWVAITIMVASGIVGAALNGVSSCP